MESITSRNEDILSLQTESEFQAALNSYKSEGLRFMKNHDAYDDEESTVVRKYIAIVKKLNKK